MNLVVQGKKLDLHVLSPLIQLTAAEQAEQLSPTVFCLVNANEKTNISAYCHQAQMDWAWIPSERQLTDFGLFVTDMDSTLINIECIDEIADMQGLKTEVAQITEEAMQGKIDFRQSLTRRVALLAGLPESALEDVYTQRLKLNPGAVTLLEGLHRAGIRTMLISGGFTYFTNRLKQELGFDYAYANELEIVDGYLTGKVVPPVIDAQAKAGHLIHARTALGLQPEQVIAVGDGANDALMLDAAGFGIAYHAKTVLYAHADACINHGSLADILNLFPPPVAR